MGANQQQNQWPIYSLANYNGSGSLLDLCRQTLFEQHNNSDNDRSPTYRRVTSGYLTQEEPLFGINRQQQQQGRNSRPNEQAAGLQWWQLIEEQQSGGGFKLIAGDTDELYGSRVMDLCFKLQQAISPFLTNLQPTSSVGSNRLLMGSRSLQISPEQHQQESLSLKQQQKQVPRTGNSIGGEDNSRGINIGANLRRLSWRQKVRPEAAATENPIDTESARHLATPGGKFWKLKSDTTAVQFPLAKWLKVNKSTIEMWQNTNKNKNKNQNRTSLACGNLEINNRKVCWSKELVKRGKYGESLVHVLIVNQTNEHLLLLVLLLHLWPALAADLFESQKFKGLSCLHLAVAYGNERLLKYLAVGVGSSVGAGANIKANKYLEQQVTGTLFRVPDFFGFSGEQTYNNNNSKQSLFKAFNLRQQGKKSATGSGGNSSPNSFGYWCDLEEHWPTANGHTHLLLFDRFLARGMQRLDNEAAQDTSAKEECGPIYLGKTPLHWSVSFNSRSMYEILVSAGANQNAQDSQGNTCLHQLVLNDTRCWARFLVKSGASTNLRDKSSFTPLLLACHLGRSELFNEFLELTAVEFWSYSMISCCGYPLTQLDSIPTSGGSGEADSMRKITAMTAILESKVSSDEQKAQLLSSAVVKKLLEEKWRIFARSLFYRQLILALVHLALMTLSISLRPPAQLTETDRLPKELGEILPKVNSTIVNEQASLNLPLALTNLWHSMDRPQMVRHFAELSTVFLSTCQLIRFAEEWFRYNNLSLQWIYNPLLPNLVTSNGLILICFFVRLIGIWLRNFTVYDDQQKQKQTIKSFAKAEDVLLIFAAPLLWSSLLFFIAAFRVTGPFVAMIRHMIVRDLRQFSLIYMVFLYAFAQCIFFVNYQKPTEQSVNEDEDKGGENFLFSLLSNYLELLMELFHMTLGVFDLQPYRHSNLARLFFLLFIYLIPILFNMLIAMMNNTYSQIISQSERAWSFQWARTLFALERCLGDNERVAYLRLYSINMPAPAEQSNRESADQSPTKPEDDVSQKEVSIKEDNKRLVPALMIIKRMKFTRAERRRLISGYWQRSTRSILDEIKLKNKEQ